MKTYCIQAAPRKFAFGEGDQISIAWDVMSGSSSPSYTPNQIVSSSSEKTWASKLLCLGASRFITSERDINGAIVQYVQIKARLLIE